jgi:succinoglycan biosynthesis transport protein ExoP
VTVLRRQWLTLVVMTLLGVGAAAVLSQTQTRMYSAQTQMMIEPLSSASTSTGGVMTPAEVASQVEVVTSRPVAATVVNDLGLAETPETLLKSVTAESNTLVGKNDIRVLTTSIPLLTISALRPQAGGAAAIANSFAAAYLKYGTEQAAEQRRTVTQSYPASIVTPATIPTSPAQPRPLRSELLGGIAGLLLGVGPAFIRDHFDDGHRAHSG